MHCPGRQGIWSVCNYLSRFLVWKRVPFLSYSASDPAFNSAELKKQLTVNSFLHSHACPCLPQHLLSSMIAHAYHSFFCPPERQDHVFLLWTPPPPLGLCDTAVPPDSLLSFSGSAHRANVPQPCLFSKQTLVFDSSGCSHSLNFWVFPSLLPSPLQQDSFPIYCENAFFPFYFLFSF